MIDKKDKRIKIIVGHYGSGKSEFSINYAISLARSGQKTALVDLDIANPYFRSREKQFFLEKCGITVYSNTLNYDITADFPAITARIRTPLEDETCQTIIDAGGNDSGARVLNQFTKYFKKENTDIFCVVNANRYETRTLETATAHLIAIEEELGLKVTGLINNTHMLWETSEADMLKGYDLCLKMSENLKIPIKYNCGMDEIEYSQKKISDLNQTFISKKKSLGIFPINMYLRERWQ